MDIDFIADDQQIKEKKERIAKLKAAIENEKARINSLQEPQIDINEAATIIQKCWRGYNYRQSSKSEEKKTENEEEKDENEEKKDENEDEEIEMEFSEFEEEEEEEEEGEEIIYDDTNIMEQLEYNENSYDEYDDENGVFNVTGVSHPNRGSDDDSLNEDYKLAPADASNPNFS